MAAIAGNTLRSALPAGVIIGCHFVLLDKDESCPTADLSNISPSRWSSLFDRWAVEHAPDVLAVHLVHICDSVYRVDQTVSEATLWLLTSHNFKTLKPICVILAN